MCECCSHLAEEHRGHVHVKKVDTETVFRALEKALSNVPGILSVELVKSAGEAKVVFDKRIVPVQSLEQALDNSGFFLS